VLPKKKKKKKKERKEKNFASCQVAHAYNLSYSGGRDQEDSSSKPAWANSSMRSNLKKKKKSTKKG
jgi:hypothetical protein